MMRVFVLLSKNNVVLCDVMECYVIKITGIGANNDYEHNEIIKYCRCNV